MIHYFPFIFILHYFSFYEKTFPRPFSFHPLISTASPRPVLCRALEARARVHPWSADAAQAPLLHEPVLADAAVRRRARRGGPPRDAHARRGAAQHTRTAARRGTR